MDFLAVFFSVLEKLEKENIPYMIVGSLASMVYGEARLTRDMDLVVDIQPQDAHKFETLFPLNDFYCPPSEILRSEVIHRGQFNLIHHESGLKVDILIRKDSPHSKLEFTRRRKLPFWEGAEAYIASPEDVIIKKLSYFREGGSDKHLKDIRGILSETPLDQNYLQHWIADLRLEKEWIQVSGRS